MTGSGRSVEERRDGEGVCVGDAMVVAWCSEREFL